MKIKTLLIFASFFLTTQVIANPVDSIQEFFPFENPEYIGYRIALADLSSNSKNGFLHIVLTPINTGRQDLLFGKKITPPPSLVVNFDDSLETLGLTLYADDMRAAVMNLDFQVAAGKISQPVSFKIPLKTDEELTRKEEPMETEVLENPRMAKSQIKEQETIIEKEAVVDDFEKALTSSSQRNNLKTTPEEKGSGSSTQYDENACSDLVFESIKIVKKTRSKVILEYTIINQGQGPATMIKNRKDENKNMALQAHFSSGNKLTKGSLNIGGSFVEKGLNQSNGKLYPGEKYTNTIKFDIQKMTKFTPYIILEMDPYLSVYECDKKNNKMAVKVGEGMER